MGRKSQGITGTRQGYGTSTAYRIAKLKRDAPEIVGRLAAGEFKTVRAAERAAGLFVDKPPLDRFRRQWDKLSFEDQERFLCGVLGCSPDELLAFIVEHAND
jgi:hypothetical protein